jgi:hypothetical protein
LRRMSPSPFSGPLSLPEPGFDHRDDSLVEGLKKRHAYQCLSGVGRSTDLS